MNLMSSIQAQLLSIKAHHSQYPAIDAKTTLKGSASGKITFVAGASQGIGQATAVAFAQAGAAAIYITARSEKALEETKARVSRANPDTQCEYAVCDLTDEEQVKASMENCVAKFGGLRNVGAAHHALSLGLAT
jgi:NAD(P)-dependent dehydrogenase (short-subunit alcohol dehydrogenase family)